jgi:hypothetical protein
MPAGSTYTPIANTTGTGSSSSVTFSSIPSTYTDLILIANGAVTSLTGNPCLQFNSDTGNNYSYTNLYGTGSAAGSYRDSNSNKIQLVGNTYFSTTLNTNLIIHIQNYSNATTNKTVLCRSNKATDGVDESVGLWRSTAAINSITFLTANGFLISANSTFTLYGIASA